MYVYIYILCHSRSYRYISTNLGKLKQAKSCQPGLSTSGREDVMEGIISRVVELAFNAFCFCISHVWVSPFACATNPGVSSQFLD